VTLIYSLNLKILKGKRFYDVRATECGASEKLLMIAEL
jgi:hypothetical protein